MHSCRLSLYGHERLPPSQQRQEVTRGTVNATQLPEPRQREQLGHENSMSHATNATAHLPARGRAGKLQNQSLPQGPTTARLALPHARLQQSTNHCVPSVGWSPALRPPGTCQGLGAINPPILPGRSFPALLDPPPGTQREREKAQRAWRQGFCRREPSLLSAAPYLSQWSNLHICQVSRDTNLTKHCRSNSGTLFQRKKKPNHIFFKPMRNSYFKDLPFPPARGSGMAATCGK